MHVNSKDGDGDEMTEKNVSKKNIIKLINSTDWNMIEDSLISEKKLLFSLNGKAIDEVVMTKGDEELWVLGHLLTSHLINDAHDLISLKISEDKIEAKTAIAIDNLRSSEISADWSISPKLIYEGIKKISEAPIYKETGSAHVAALMAISGEFLFMAEDIKRHNAVDKAIGWLLKNKYDPLSVMLFTSGRLPEDMVLKAKIAKIPLVASISAATKEGVELAKASNITLVGFVREGRMNIYSHPERIKIKEYS